ncbi:P-loop containing nucleoside triphosphate hydrolase protein, partial [Anaeromyces robustus]
MNSILYFKSSIIFENIKFRLVLNVYLRENEIDDGKVYYYKPKIERENRWNENEFIEISDLSKLLKVNVVDDKNEEEIVEIKNDKKGLGFYFAKVSKYSFLKRTPKEIKVILNHLNFKIYKNEIFGIIGLHNSGKNMLLKILVGLNQGTFGNIYYNGIDLFSEKSDEIRKDIAVCYNYNYLINELTVEENIIFHSKIKNISIDVNQILKEIGLENEKYKVIKHLNKIQKKKLNIAITLMLNCKYIIMDEPTLNFDNDTKRKIWEIILSKKQGKTIIFTTNDIDEATIISDRNLILNNGNIYCLGSSSYIKKHLNIN